MFLSKQLLKTTDSYINKLQAGGIVTVSDLLHHYPRDIQNKSAYIEEFQMIDIRIKSAVVCEIETIVSSKTRNNMLLTKAILKDKNEYMVEAVWFQNHFLTKQFKRGDRVLIYGKPKYSYGKIEFPHPDMELFSADRAKIQPIYSEVQGISSEWIERKIELLKPFIIDLPDVLPQEFRIKKNFPHHYESIKNLHFPSSLQEYQNARHHLAYEEIFTIQFAGLSKKQSFITQTQDRSCIIPLAADSMKIHVERLPYSLTNTQKISLFQIMRDMERPYAMNRLLQGDVGSGKTVVALLSSLYVIEQSHTQVAFMVPTEILATQHFAEALPWFESLGFSTALLTGSTPEEQKKVIKEKLKEGNIDLVIGTHALIQEDVDFKDLGFVIIDEQHRFGVEQRKKLEGGHFFKNSTNRYPHVLYMTATPIPRTLALTFHGDQDISIINEYPAGRQKILTYVVKESKKNEMYRLIESEIEKGRQVYWISPLVEESETLDVANATQTYEFLCELFPKFTVWLLHGRMRPKEKDAIMQDFLANKIQILSSTSVVEVGVNNPNATIMCIEAAERFGLSQLHQFRGRVGRGIHQSYCFLFTTKTYVDDRLKAMEQTNDGFLLSEMDLKMRWPGEVYGLRQSWAIDIKLADLYDVEAIAEIREDIETILFKKTSR